MKKLLFLLLLVPSFVFSQCDTLPLTITHDGNVLDMCSEFKTHNYSVEDINDVTYYWSVDSVSQIESDNDISLTWDDTTDSYLIQVYGVDFDGCSTDTVSLVINTNSCHKLYIPNSFSPNNDGVNDVFTFKGTNVFNPRMEIYTRWGELVCLIESSSQVWTGNVNNSGYFCESGIYTWKMFYRDDKGTPFYERGYVSLIR